jgi:HEXXH motif-containing protein
MLQQAGLAADELFGSVKANGFLRDQRRKSLERLLFLSSTLLKKGQVPVTVGLGADSLNVVDAYWDLPAVGRLAVSDEPLFSYVVNWLFRDARGQGRAADVRTVLELFGSLLIDVALRRRDDFVIERPILVSSGPRGGVETPNWPEVARTLPPAPTGRLRVEMADAGTLRVEDADGATYELDAQSYSSQARSAILEGGLRLESGSWYRRIGRQILDRYIESYSEGEEDPAFSDPRDPTVRSRFEEALSLVAQHAPDTFADLQAHTQVVIPIRTPDSQGFSVDSCRGAVFVKPEEHVVGTIDYLVHENYHQKLDTINDLYPILEGMTGEVFPSPWRTDPRPMIGVIHGSYVFTRTAHTLLEITGALPELEEVSRPLVRMYRRQVGEALGTIEQNAKLTEVGRGFLRTVRAWQEALPE